MTIPSKRPRRTPTASAHARAQSSSFVSSLLLVLLCIVGMTSGGIVHHEPGEIQNSYNLFHLLNTYVVPPPSSDKTPQHIVTECPPNVIFVMDGSGSISFAGFNTIKTAVVREIRALMAAFAQVDIGVVLFSEDNLVIPIETRTPAQMEEMIRTIQNLDHPRLGTELNEAIREARRALAVHSTNAQRALNGDKSGNILVLFTDGNVEPNIEKASASEVQIAQSKGILVLIDTVEEPSRTVHNIAPTVLESRTPINWVDYVACPPATLDAPPRGSACRDFYMVVDGSDTVLRFEGTIRQYLAYTALRYRNVNNAIGINIYGTDTKVQARNTRIRMTEDKHELADDIRQQLRFPRSRGAGTSHAVIQSIGFLNDDIRDKPAGLVLIMNGPPLDLQATAQAIRQARQQGYPVVIIRIGQVSDSEMNTLASGDTRGVFNIQYVTDLYGVNFDDVICAGGVCQLTPQSCTPPRTFHQSSCSCVCGNTCAVGSTHGPNCQCQCEGTCPVGQTHDNNCLCRCPSNCPQGTRQNSDCSCTACPFRCENNQFQDPNCACQCRNQCPPFSIRNNQCGCLCELTNRPPDATGVCPRESDSQACRLTQADCGTRQLDLTACRCVVRCPVDATPIGTESCRCTNPSQTYDANRNLCVCPISCPEGQLLEPRTCECSCASSCPSGQYNTPGSNCQCLCLDTNQPPVGGVCGGTTRCPANSTPVGTTCRCNTAGFQYNPTDNTCVRSCPSDADPIRDTCQCREGNKAYDGAGNRCVCRTTCQTGSVQNPTTCVCSCPTQCPVGQYNTVQGNCQCLCTSSNQPPVGGRCLVCPSNARPVGSTCQCNDPNSQYNSGTNTCVPVRRCPSDATPSGNTCVCRNTNRRYDPNTNQCVCSQACQPGQVQNPTTCACSCATQCPAGQYNNAQTNCRCLCTSTNQPPVGGRCLQCPSDATPSGNTCQCRNTNRRYDANTNRCVCSQACPTGQVQNPTTCACSCATQCPTGQYNNIQTNCRCLCTSTNQPPVGGRCLVCPSNARPVGSTCQCNDPNSQYNSGTNTCVRRCPSDATPSGNTCQCRNTNRVYDANSNRCVCRQACPTGQVQNPTTCACSCPTQCPTGQYNNVQTNCQCLCTSTNQPPVGGRCLVCPSNARPVGSTCQCNDPNSQYNSGTNTCVRRCPSDATPSGNTCVCRNNNRRYDSNSNQCVCSQACQPGQVQNPTTCMCSCATQCPAGQYNNAQTNCRCLCTSTNQPPVGGRCLQCPSNATPMGNTCQCRDSTRRYDANSNLCVCSQTCPTGQVQNPTTCACSCATQCPTGQYNNAGTNCQCLCTSTNQPPVGGRCLTCPSNSRPMGNSCQCTDPNFQYNSATNACVRNCPSDASPISDTCECREGRKAYDEAANRCVCRTRCEQGSTQNPTTCACSCTTQCPAGQYNNAQSNCQCLCTSTNQPPVGGRCLVCPSNARLVGSTCQCNDPNSQYNGGTNTCVRRCPTDATPSGNTCQCRDSTRRYDSTSNRCVCRQACQPGQVQNPTTCACSCATQCPTGQYNNAQTNCRCLCTSTNQPPVGGRCLVCPSNARPMGSTCQCNDPNSQYNSGTNTCVRRCPSDATPSGNTCQCRDATRRFDQASNRCVCRQACQPGSVQNPTTCACSCATQCPTGQYNNVQTNCRCLCTSTNQPPVGGRCLVCPSNARPVGSTCQCNDPNSQYNSGTNTCVRRCPSDATPSGNTCQCRDTTRRYDANANRCVCATACTTPGSVQNPTTCTCSCSTQCPAGQYNNVQTNCRCLCTSTNQPPVGGRCLVCPSNARLVGSTCQCNDPNSQYNSGTNTCVRRCPSDAIPSGNTCQCRDNAMRFDAASNRCVRQCPSGSVPSGNSCRCTDTTRIFDANSNRCACRSSCQTGSVQNPTTCACSCATQCPVGQYNNPGTSCRCLCTTTNQPPVGGRCLRQCPNDAMPVGNTCRCRSSLRRYDSNTNRCVCSAVCRNGAVQDPTTCSCTCQNTCPAGQYSSLETNCRCLCQNTRQPPQGGVCLTCPADATPAGTSCQCSDPCYTYNAITNTCVRNCPNDATLVGNTCQCRDSTKRYDSPTNQCLCRMACPIGSVQTPSTCACTCATRCPADQYNSVETGCRCLCQLDNSEPRGGVCSTRLLTCDLTQADCPTGQLLNSDPRICRCEIQQQPQPQPPQPQPPVPQPPVPQPPVPQPPVVPGRERCPESEWHCANNRPAYRDCHGACVCECTSMFAGPRCEITVNATLCDHCHYFQGIYKAGVAGFCDLFVHCHPIASAGKDSRGRPRSFSATVQRCAPGTYYVTRPDGYEGCDWLSAGTCYGDVCENLQPNTRYPDESACQRYWQCGSDRKLSKRACCPAGQGFDPTSQQCVDNPTCPDVCGPCNTTTSGGSGPSCPLAPVPGNPNQYYHLESRGHVSSCPTSLVFDPSVCTCIGGQTVDTGPKLCVPSFQTDFETPLQHEHNIPRISFQGQQVGHFRGTDDLVIKAFAQSGFHTNHFQIDFRAYLNEQPPSGSGQRVAVVTNADCDTMESVSITMDGTSFYFRIYQMGMTTPAEITIPFSGLQDANGWYKVSLVYTGRRGNFQFTATVGSRTVPYSGPVSLTNYIDRRKCALHLGYGFNYTSFRGYFDDVSVWRCKP